MPHILVIEDDASVASVVKRGLAYEGFTVDAAASGHAGLTIARDHPPDLVLLDLMLPGLSGFEVLSRLRAADAHLPIIMLTGRDAPADQVEGLERGADDYVVKPFTFGVLAARVKAVLRRRETHQPVVLRFDDLLLDTAAREVRRGDRVIELTAMEYEVLRQFLLHPRRVLPKYMLLDRIWGPACRGNVNLVEVYIKQLRQKLEDDGGSRLIHTIRGAGYILRSD